MRCDEIFDLHAASRTMFTAVKGRGRFQLQLQLSEQFCRYFSSVLPESHPFNTSHQQDPPVYHSPTKPVPISLLHTVQPQDRHHQHEIADAMRPHFQSQTPHILRHMYSKCDALYFWRSLEYWRMVVGDDMDVEIEVGKGYNSGQRVTTKFGAYLDYLQLCTEKDEREDSSRSVKSEEVAYLAQNELFSQVQQDIPIPEFCRESSGSYDIGEGKLYHTMLWMGPRDTVSPLHFDPLDNLLIQVVGWKRVLLFHPKEKTINNTTSDCADNKLWHYAGVEGNQYNTSAVDIESPDYQKYPNFKLAPVPFECTLGPGDALYIPKKWWHHVRSLDFSVSANIWWR